MKLMNEIAADEMGTIREVCVENGDAVEYGQVMCLIWSPLLRNRILFAPALFVS